MVRLDAVRDAASRWPLAATSLARLRAGLLGEVREPGFVLGELLVEMRLHLVERGELLVDDCDLAAR